MYKTVFILGAGASADTGIPVMKNFLDRAEDYNNDNSFGVEEKKDFETVSKAVHALKGASFNTSLDLHNIETIFSAIDMGRFIGRFAGFTLDEIKHLYSSIVRLIGATIDHSTVLKRISDEFKLSGTYHKFVDFLLSKYLHGNDWLASIVTFNYDIAFEYALYYKQIYPDYHLPDQYEGGTISLLKLHGSVNWSQTEEGEDIFPVNLNSFLSTGGMVGVGNRRKMLVSMNLGAPLGAQNGNVCRPVIIPPSWNKSEHYRSLRPVWKKAAEMIATAQAIYVVGYSLPETDMFFKYLFALSTHTRSSIRRFWVFDPDPEVNNRCRRMLAPGLNDGTRYKFHEMNFIEALRFLRTAVN